MGVDLGISDKENIVFLSEVEEEYCDGSLV